MLPQIEYKVEQKKQLQYLRCFQNIPKPPQVPEQQQMRRKPSLRDVGVGDSRAVLRSFDLVKQGFLQIVRKDKKLEQLNDWEKVKIVLNLSTNEIKKGSSK